MPTLSPAMCIGVTIAVGAIAGMMPAIWAARTSPTAALSS
jgi:hypothetical protein